MLSPSEGSSSVPTDQPCPIPPQKKTGKGGGWQAAAAHLGEEFQWFSAGLGGKTRTQEISSGICTSKVGIPWAHLEPGHPWAAPAGIPVIIPKKTPGFSSQSGNSMGLSPAQVPLSSPCRDSSDNFKNNPQNLVSPPKVGIPRAHLEPRHPWAAPAAKPVNSRDNSKNSQKKTLFLLPRLCTNYQIQNFSFPKFPKDFIPHGYSLPTRQDIPTGIVSSTTGGYY